MFAPTIYSINHINEGDISDKHVTEQEMDVMWIVRKWICSILYTKHVSKHRMFMSFFAIIANANLYFKHILLSNKYRQWIRHKLYTYDVFSVTYKSLSRQYIKKKHR